MGSASIAIRTILQRLQQRLSRLGAGARSASEQIRMVRARLALFAARIDRLTAPLGRNRAHAAAVSLVAVLHVLIVAALLRGLAPVLPAPPHEIELMIGGFYAPPAVTVKPEPVNPPDVDARLVEVPLPPLAADTAPAIQAAIPPQGSPNVTMPSEALAEAHAFGH